MTDAAMRPADDVPRDLVRDFVDDLFGNRTELMQARSRGDDPLSTVIPGRAQRKPGTTVGTGITRMPNEGSDTSEKVGPHGPVRTPSRFASAVSRAASSGSISRAATRSAPARSTAAA